MTAREFGFLLLGLLGGFVAVALVVVPWGFFDNATWAAVCVAFAALLVGSFQAFLAYTTAERARAAERAAMRAHCTVHTEWRVNGNQRSFELQLRNVGPGIAHVRSFVARLGDQEVQIRKADDWARVFALAGTPLPSTSRAWSVMGTGAYIRPGEDSVVTMLGPVQVPQGVNNYLAGLTLTLEIWSLLPERMSDSVIRFT